MLTWCTNTSWLPSSGVTKPKPFTTLNHLHFPVCSASRLPATEEEARITTCSSTAVWRDGVKTGHRLPTAGRHRRHVMTNHLTEDRTPPSYRRPAQKTRRDKSPHWRQDTAFLPPAGTEDTSWRIGGGTHNDVLIDRPLSRRSEDMTPPSYRRPAQKTRCDESPPHDAETDAFVVATVVFISPHLLCIVI